MSALLTAALKAVRNGEADIGFDQQDSGSVSYRVMVDGEHWFVKTATTDRAVESFSRACAVHRAVRHEAIVPLFESTDGAQPVLLYRWMPGQVLNQSTTAGSDRSGLHRFHTLAAAEKDAAISTIIDAHVAVVAAGFVSIDLYDGCFLYDFDAATMRLIDLDEYEPGPFILDADRTFGSSRFMAPEEWVRGATLDERTTVFELGRTVQILLDSDDRFSGTAAQSDVAEHACRPDPDDRYQSVEELAAAWLASVPPS